MGPVTLFRQQHKARSRRSDNCLAAAAVVCLVACGGASDSATPTGDWSRDASVARADGGGGPIAIKLDAASVFKPSVDGAASAVDGGVYAPATCGVSTTTLFPRPAEVMLVLDRSTTMADALPADETDKWTATVSGIESAVLASHDATAWGLMLFPKATDDSACCQMPANDLSPVAEVAPEQQSTSAISAALAQSAPTGIGAPTARALIQAANYLVARGTGTSKYIVLASGADPTCASDSLCTGASTIDYARTKETVAHVASVLGIPVAVAGIALPAAGNVIQPNSRVQLFTDLANLGGMLEAAPS